ncbi:alpha-tocopherol transfer protein-like isoform X2 [Cylas formicarius]|uniref:alpha-tocopherol transfer protein-like isoform X2 n=1 Tax=Cylas formicarius TaxID=197179 RepID=UPI002958A9D6|nr:alpha-tocopherol transfer protein-like isoform X2 [Cylas formicarius]
MVLSVEVNADGTPFVAIGQYQFRLEVEELYGEYKKMAENELQETPQRVSDGLNRLRDLIKAEDDLYLPVDDDRFLIKFLRPFRFNPEHGFKVMRRFYLFKTKYPKYGGNGVTPHAVRHVFDNEVFVFLPTRSKTGGRIMIINCGKKWDPKLVKLEDMFRSIMVAIEIAMLEPKTQVGGVNVILNMEGLGLHHVYQFSPSMAKLIIDWVQECAPVRLRGLHVVNQPFVFNVLFAIFKPFLGEYIKKRLSFHGSDRPSLAEKIGREGLPEKYGGTADIPDYPGSLFSDMLFYYEEEFRVHNTYGYGTTTTARPIYTYEDDPKENELESGEEGEKIKTRAW